LICVPEISANSQAEA